MGSCELGIESNHKFLHTYPHARTHRHIHMLYSATHLFNWCLILQLNVLKKRVQTVWKV